jgi:hypothetical protein
MSGISMRLFAGTSEQFLEDTVLLLSRGMKGCYIYFVDKDTEKFFKSRIEK